MRDYNDEKLILWGGGVGEAVWANFIAYKGLLKCKILSENMKAFYVKHQMQETKKTHEN
jgi:hypothetical protein